VDGTDNPADALTKYLDAKLVDKYLHSSNHWIKQGRADTGLRMSRDAASTNAASTASDATRDNVGEVCALVPCEFAGDRVTDREPTTYPRHPGPRFAEGSFSDQERLKLGSRPQRRAGASIPSDRPLKPFKGYSKRSECSEDRLDKKTPEINWLECCESHLIERRSVGYSGRFKGSENHLDNQSFAFVSDGIRGITAGYESQLRRSANIGRPSPPTGYYPKLHVDMTRRWIIL